MTQATRVLIGLITGLLLGVALAGNPSPAATTLLAIIAPIGTIFVNLIRMTVVPLIASMVVASVGTMPSSAGLGLPGLRAVAIALALLVTAAVGSGLVAQAALARIPIDSSAARALVARDAGDPGTATAVTTTATQWFLDLVPQNIVRAAADGAVLPVILFSALFGFALTRVEADDREALLRAVRAAADAMQQIVLWILKLAPVGIFALAVPLAARLGWSAAGAVVAYIVLVVALTIAAVALLLYPLGILAGRISASAFISYCAPSQALAFASRSSLATLPAMIQSAELAGLPPGASRFVMPLALSMFHFGAAIAQTVGVVFLAHLFGITLTPAQSASVVVAVVLASIAVPGIPGGSIIAMTPVLLAARLPLEGIGILLAVDAIPDMFRTTANVTGAMTLAAVLQPRQIDRRHSTGVG